MFAATVYPGTLRSLFSPVGAFVNECEVRVSESGVSVSAVDDASIGLVNMVVDKDVFDSFEADECKFGLPVNRFLKVLDLCSENGEKLYLMFNESENTLEIEFNGLYYSLSLLELKSVKDVPEIPDLDLSCLAGFSAAELEDAISASDMFSDFITLQSNGSKVSVSGGGENNAVLMKSGSELLQFNGGKADSTFKISYFKSIVNSVSDEEKIIIESGVDYPSFVTVSPGDTECTIEYLLAPRITGE